MGFPKQRNSHQSIPTFPCFESRPLCNLRHSIINSVPCDWIGHRAYGLIREESKENSTRQTESQDFSTVYRSRSLAILGSLSTRVFETRTATGSELFSFLTCPHTTTFTLLCIFSPLEMNSRKIWETIRSKNANCSLPVAVRVSKTRVLKLPICIRRTLPGRVTLR